MPEARYKRQWRKISRVKKALDQHLEYYFERTIPIFDSKMGKRLQGARHVMRMTQTQLGEYLGLSQSDVHRLEHGKVTYLPVTVSKFRSALADHFDYVFRGAASLRYEYGNFNKNKKVETTRQVKRV